MKIIITGFKGMLGQDLAKIFHDQELFLMDKEDLDITQVEQVKNKINEIKPDVIINAAAFNAVDDIEKDPTLAMKINGNGPRNLAEAAKAIGAIFVHYSSDYVFDGLKSEGYVETDATNPISKYGESKLAGEKNALEVGGKVYVLRTSRLFGLPALTEGAKKSFVDVMRQLVEQKNEFNLVDEEISSPTYSPDLAMRTREIIENKEPFGLYHATNDGRCSWFEFAEEVFKILNKNPKLNRVGADAFPRPAKRPKHSVLLNTKLAPMRSWRLALREYLEKV
jgi:dTDP-4-dehydrorhamnose reductase